MNYKMGWLKDFPDIRDYNVKRDEVAPCKIDEKVLPLEYRITSLPPIKDQGQLGSCTANAGTYMYETFVQQAGLGVSPAMSRLFLYKTTRKLMGSAGDTGAYLRDTMKAMALFGTVPESYWPYVTGDFEKEPTAFEYAMADHYEALTYYRLDPHGKDLDKVIDSIKLNLVSNRACMMGFVVYNGCMDAHTGKVAMPGLFSSVSGGHAICVVGYNDTVEINGVTGAFTFANSWSSSWGDNGYGYLPYKYVKEGLATDWWTMMTGAWLDLDVFK